MHHAHILNLHKQYKSWKVQTMENGEHTVMINEKFEEKTSVILW